MYWGNFVNGKFDGEGILMYTANDVHKRVKYQGHWKDGQREGHGTLRFKDGTEFVGDFKHDQFHGHGTFTLIGENQSNFYNEHWTNLHDRCLGYSFVQDVEIETALKRWLDNEIPPNGETYEGRWENGCGEGIVVRTSSEGKSISTQKYSKGDLVNERIWDSDSSSSEDEDYGACSDSAPVYPNPAYYHEVCSNRCGYYSDICNP